MGHQQQQVKKRQHGGVVLSNLQARAQPYVERLERHKRAAATTAVDDDDDDDTLETTITRATVARTTATARTTTAVDDDDDDETTTTTRRTTTARARTTSTTTTDDDEDEETTTTSRTTAARTALTTSSTSTTTSSTSTSTSRTALTSSTRSTTSSASRTTSSTSASTTASGISNNDTSSSTSKGSSTNAGAIAGAIIAVVVVAAILLFFGLRWRKNKKKKAEEAAAIYPYGGGHGGANAGSLGGSTNGGAGAFNKRQSGYARQVDAYDEMGASRPHGDYGEKYGEYGNEQEKYGNGNMAGYGSMASMAGRGAFGGMPDEANNAGRASYNSSNTHLLGRDNSGNLLPLQPGAYLTSPTFTNNSGRDSRFSDVSSSANHAAPGDFVGYPPMQNSRMNNGPQAAMMRHEEAVPLQDTNHLPPHQDSALNAAFNAGHPNTLSSPTGIQNTRDMVPSSPFGNGNMAAAAAAGVAAGAGAAAFAGGNQANNSQAAPADAQNASPFADPAYEGKIFTVTRIFEPSMPDELVIHPGDKIQIVMAYDDGWCLGCNLTSVQRNGGGEPARGVFPRDCVEEDAPSAPASESRARPPSGGLPAPGSVSPALRNVHETIQEEDEELDDEDKPVVSPSAVDLQRAPTLPPLDIGGNSDFSLDGTAAQRQGSRPVSQATTATAKRRSSIPNSAGTQFASATSSPANKRQSLAVPASYPLPPSEAGNSDTEDDPYGGYAASTSPMTNSFAPNIQVSNSAPVPAENAKRISQQLPPSLVAGGNPGATVGPRSRLSALEEENRQLLLEEFPSTPRTDASPNIPFDSARRSQAIDPQGQRLSVAGLPSSNSARSLKSLKRTSSLIASKDANLMLSPEEQK